LACVARRHVRPEADVDVRVLTGPEALTGSTRMKAGLATKMVLNTVTTLAMVRMGKVYENLMVDLNSYACRKLTDRAARTLATLTGLSYEASSSLLKRARGQVKVALVMHHRGVDRPRAEGLLKKARGQVREAMRRREV
ncbi:MAG: N-acetylmuramic acid 6-phosphate etherase, partial [Phycisphaerae bacterium]|nr:N-acetylmuramic acid 6-phosphate etherase [Phycisphaerae bacterium]